MADEAAWWRELEELDARRAVLDRRIREAEQRARYIGDPQAVEAARKEAAALLTDMDRLMTRSRAVEGKLLLARKAKPAG